MAKIYYEKDADLKNLKGKTVAVIGYGSQGRAQSLNLRDSGVDVVVGIRPDGGSAAVAREDRMKIAPVEEAAKRGDIIQMLVPDDQQAAVYERSISPFVKKGNMLLFSHGFNIHYGQIVPPKDVDVAMVAPKAPGPTVRSNYVEGRGTPALVAIHQNATGNALKIALAHAKGIGATRAGVLETTFKEETETDLFGEQTVLCGGVTSLIKAGFETLVAAGYQPESAYFECLHELKLIVDLIQAKGIGGMRDAISTTAKYGDVTMGPIIIDEGVKQRMAYALNRIQTGAFAKEWILENKAGRPIYNKLLERDREHMIEKVGAELRKMFSWSGKEATPKVVGKTARKKGR